MPINISIGALIVSIISLFWNYLLEHKRKKAKLQIWQRNTFYAGGEDERTKINLILRNLSHRPTGIIDIYAKDSNGGVIKTIGEEDGLSLPIKASPWDVQIISFRIKRQDEERIDHISLRDLDDKEIVVKRGQGKRWYQ